jgi:hypothetical protein
MLKGYLLPLGDQSYSDIHLNAGKKPFTTWTLKSTELSAFCFYFRMLVRPRLRLLTYCETPQPCQPCTNALFGTEI